MTALISKPGLTAASGGLAIPKDWSKIWFRSFIDNLLKGADVRNAVGIGGIVVSGNITSPYATIGFGAPVTLPSPVTIPAAAGQISLTVNGAANQNTILVSGSSTTGQSFGLDIRAGTNSSDRTAIFRNAAATTTYFFIRGDGLLQGFGVTAGGLVDMTPDAGSTTLTLATGCTTTPTATAVWSKQGNQVTITVTSLTGTSNATGMTISGLPAEIQPTRTQLIACVVEDNGSNVAGAVQMVAASGTMTFLRGVVSGTAVTISSTGFTNTGTKGLNQTTWTYELN